MIWGSRFNSFSFSLSSPGFEADRPVTGHRKTTDQRPATSDNAQNEDDENANEEEEIKMERGMLCEL